MSKHTSLPNNTNFALKVLTEHYDSISENFSEFFPQLIAHVKKNHRVNLPYDSES
jgi:acyl carrier protein phosphodiesterase